MPAQPSDRITSFVEKTYGRLDELSYYDLLGVSSVAAQAEVRSAFYRLSNDLHPDRYHMLADRELKERLEIIYARICEGYRVLTLPEKRAVYTRALAAGKKRLTSTDREANAPQSTVDSLKHEEAKKFFRLGTMSLASHDYKGAVMNFNFARSFEPDAAIIKQKLGEAQAALGKPGGPGVK